MPRIDPQDRNIVADSIEVLQQFPHGLVLFRCLAQVKNGVPDLVKELHARILDWVSWKLRINRGLITANVALYFERTDSETS